MVQGIMIQCDVCDEHFHVKYQMDETVRLYPWNLDFQCPECGDRIHLTFGAQGVNRRYTQEELDEEAYLIGYSSCLPITKEMYLNKMDRGGRIAFFSPFFNLSRLYPESDYRCIQGQRAMVEHILSNVFKYRKSLTELLPLLNKANMKPEAYAKKVMQVFGLKGQQRGIQTYKDCVGQYSGMVDVCYRNLVPPTFKSEPYGHLFIGLMAYAKGAPIEEISLLKQELDKFGNIKDWMTKRAFKHIAQMVGKVEKYFPAMFYGVTGEYVIPHQEQLYLMTISHEEVNNDYRNGFEVLEKILPAFVGMANKLFRGDPNSFGKDLFYTLLDFVDRTVGARIGLILKDEVYSQYFKGSLDSKIRNSETHDDWEFDSETQICRYEDQDNREVKIELPLMDVAFMTYIQLLHIMEITIIFNTMLQRIWK